jgi:hypothetical protein
VSLVEDENAPPADDVNQIKPFAVFLIAAKRAHEDCTIEIDIQPSLIRLLIHNTQPILLESL